MLEFAAAGGALWKTFVGAVFLGQLAGGLEGGMIDGLEDFFVELLGPGGVEGESQPSKGVSESGNAHPHRTVSAVGRPCLVERVEVHVDDTIEVPHQNLDRAVEGGVVKGSTGRLGRNGAMGSSGGADEFGEADGGQIAYSDLICVSVLDDFSAKVGGFDSAQVLLVGFGIAGVFVEDVGGAGLSLRVEDGVPEFPGLHLFGIAFFMFILMIEFLKLFSVHVRESGTFVGTHEGPLPVLLNPLHKKIGHPEPVEEVARPIFLLPMIFLQIKHVKDVRMPGLYIDCERSGSLASSLVYVAGGDVEDPQHGYQTVGGPAGAGYVRPARPDVVN
mmetsp:Transcript_7613/g.16524  ORF Transcript_7613/g.16524 Transcript_7613/m.16524 type:complete len:331 (-) Transcript_7613:1550-2542(-)